MVLHSQSQVSPSDILYHLLSGTVSTHLITVAARMRIADHLAHGISQVNELAIAVSAEPDALYRFLRALAAYGVVTETEPKCFALTPVGEGLRTDIPNSMYSLVQWVEFEEQFWACLEQCLKTGKTAFDHLYNMGMFDYLQQHPEMGALFDRSMTGLVSRNITAIVGSYDFTPFANIVDVGGGHGSLLAAILKETPAANGVIFDLPGVLEGAKTTMETVGLANRCQYVGGDFFSSLPDGGDIYLLASIIHDWDDEQSLTILKNCRRAIRNAARLLIVEMVITPGSESPIATDSDLFMLLETGGRERTQAEFEGLLSGAGFRLLRVIPTSSTVSILEAIPV